MQREEEDRAPCSHHIPQLWVKVSCSQETETGRGLQSLQGHSGLEGCHQKNVRSRILETVTPGEASGWRTVACYPVPR